MITELFIKKWIPFAAGFLILLAFTAILFHTTLLFDVDSIKYPIFVYFLGINLILVVIGTLILAFYLIRQLSICVTHTCKLEEMGIENKNKLVQQNIQNTDAKDRRINELERNQINDIFRLFELAKYKSEEIPEKNEVAEKQDTPKNIVTNKAIKKYEGLDTEKLASLIKQYEDLISKHHTK